MNVVLSVLLKVLARAKQSSDVVLAVVMASIVGAMIVPLPAWLLDVGLALNLAAALCLLVAALYAKDALKVASFPTLLLMTTLFRLAMNVSSTRLALSEGHAGEIIEAFGEFVVRGNYVVGAVIFSILTLVQFLVVAKGAERVAEVSARFTLDAMPGKQMSIDADLRAGAIDQAQARTRRRQLERESQLFGSMDGAMKFVKGDVIAGLVIVLVNLLGGTVIGVLDGGMSVSDAASTYALIAIGDGLVSQLPSLCVAVAAGLVVTRVSSESDEASLGADIGSQFFGQWKALLVVAVLCLAVGAVPGMPHLTFGAVSLVAALAGLALKTVAARKAAAAAVHAVPPTSASKPRELDVGVKPLVLDLAADLTALCEEEGGRFITEDLNRVRERVQRELGVKVPGFYVRQNAPLPPGQYELLVDEVPVGKGRTAAGQLFAMVPLAELQLMGITGDPAVNPFNGKAISRVSAADRERLETAHVPSCSSRELVAEHLGRLLKKHAGHLLGVQQVQQLVEQLEPTAPALVKEAINKVPLSLLTEVLRRLVAENVSIRNLRAILDALVAPTTEGDALALADACRRALSRQLTHQYAPNGPLFAFLVDPSVEEALRTSGPRNALEPNDANAIVEGARRIAPNGKAVLLASPDVRRPLRRLLEGVLPEVAVLTYGELEAELQIRPVGRLTPAAAR